MFLLPSLPLLVLIELDVAGQTRQVEVVVATRLREVVCLLCVVHVYGVWGVCVCVLCVRCGGMYSVVSASRAQ